MAKHLFKKIDSKKIFVKNSSLADESFVRDLRNDKKLRKINFLKRKVGESEHHGWFIKLLEKNYSYTVFLGETKVGHIRFERIKSGVFLIGLAFLPKYSGCGIGPVALKKAFTQLKKKEPGAKIIAEVRSSNLPAQKFFLKVGFKSDYFVYKIKI